MSCKERADGGDWQLSSLIFSQSYVLHNSGASHILGNKYKLDSSEKLTEVALFQPIFGQYFVNFYAPSSVAVGI